MPRRPKESIQTVVVENSLVELEAVQRMSRDVANAGATLSDEEAGYLVREYYSWQDKRKRSESQLRALMDKKVPHSILQWSLAQDQTMEQQYRRALEKYTDSHPIGAWMKSQYAIGPVIAAGMMSHIDIYQAPVVSSIWRIAGYEPDVIWGKADNIRKHIQAHVDDFERYLPPDAHQLRLERRQKLHQLTSSKYDVSIARLAEGNLIPESDFRMLCGKNGNELRLWLLEFMRLNALDCRQLLDGTPLESVTSTDGITMDTVRWAALYFGRHRDTLLRFMMPKSDDPEEAMPKTPDLQRVRWTMAAISASVARRPFNGELRTLCWKAGQSFMKFSKHPDCFYGKLYRERKAYEVLRNEQGGNRERAEHDLLLVGTHTDAHEWLSKGMLPPAHIDARARRWAVKIFLSHLHHVWYWYAFGKEPPKPFALEHRGHVHNIQVPGFVGISADRRGIS